MSKPIRKQPTLQEFKELGKKMEQDRIKMLSDFKIDEATWKEIEFILEKSRCPIVIKLE